MAINISCVANKNDLMAILKCIDISVPLRTEGRLTPHIEAWSICHLLSTLADSSSLIYPLSLIHRDRPDFLLRYGSAEIGIEVTEAVSEQYAAYSALAEREFSEVLLEPGHFKWGSPKRTVEQMRTLLHQKQLSSAPWEGDRPEREWALYMENVIEAKLKKLSNPDFGKFAENWLAIYDNLSLPNIHLERALNFLRPTLEDQWCRIPGFTSIFVEHGSMIAKLTPTRISCMDLHDLW